MYKNILEMHSVTAPRNCEVTQVRKFGFNISFTMHEINAVSLNLLNRASQMNGLCYD